MRVGFQGLDDATYPEYLCATCSHARTCAHAGFCVQVESRSGFLACFGLVLGISRLLLGRSRAFLGSPGLVLGSLGISWASLGSPGLSWASPGFSWADHFWVTSGLSWPFLGSLGLLSRVFLVYSWARLPAPDLPGYLMFCQMERDWRSDQWRRGGYRRHWNRRWRADYGPGPPTFVLMLSAYGAGLCGEGLRAVYRAIRRLFLSIVQRKAAMKYERLILLR